MCEVEVLAEAHSGVGFVAQPCRSALQTCGTVLYNPGRSSFSSIPLGMINLLLGTD